MQNLSRSVDLIQSERRVAFDEFVYNCLPRHLLYIKTDVNTSGGLDIEVIPASRLHSIFELELDGILHPDENSRISKKALRDTLKKLFRFAIFSHRWFQEGEPSFRALDSTRPVTRGYHKLVKFCERAAQFRCRLAWSDTCCIDKTSSAELDEAIRSMFRWYRLAHVCIIYLSDAKSVDELESDVWFTRGWTLQELLAPGRIKFYGRIWNELLPITNDKNDDVLMRRVSQITNIPPDDLRHFQPGTNRIRERMSWASKRTTTRTEDIAYSLIGIFDVNLQIAYGEGTWAFHRLMEAIIHRCDEWGIFAWAGSPSTHHTRTNAIPQSPACYHLIDVRRFPDEKTWVHGDTKFTLSRQGLQLCVMVVIGDMKPRVGTRGYEFAVKQNCVGPAFAPVYIQSSNRIKDKGEEWALGILNYRLVEPEGEYGKIEGGKSYVCFLLRRFKGTWVREPTDNILTIDTLFEGESREEVCRLWL